MNRSLVRWSTVMLAAFVSISSPLSALASNDPDPAFRVITRIPLPLHAAGTAAVNEALNKFYSSGGGPAGTETVEVIDGSNFSMVNVGQGSDAEVDLRTDTYWSANVYDGGVIVRSGRTNSVLATIPLGGCPIATSYDPKFNRMWVGAQCGANNDPVFAVDGWTYKVVAGPIGSGGVMGPIIANGANGRLYITEGTASKRVNPRTFALTSNAFGPVAAINAAANILYAVNGNDLQVINGAPDPEVILYDIPLGYTPYFMGVNQELDHLYVANSVGNSIEVRDGHTGALIDTFSLAATGVRPDGYIAVDSLRGRIYLTGTFGTGRALLVIEDLTTARSPRSNRG